VISFLSVPSRLFLVIGVSEYDSGRISMQEVIGRNELHGKVVTAMFVALFMKYYILFPFCKLFFRIKLTYEVPFFEMAE
jgi:hypothetical protein